MSEKQFDIFDDAFRAAADQFEPEFSEAAWQKMEAKLDKDLRRRSPLPWLRWISDAIMISLMVTMAFSLHHQPAKTKAIMVTGKAEANAQKTGDERRLTTPANNAGPAATPGENNAATAVDIASTGKKRDNPAAATAASYNKPAGISNAKGKQPLPGNEVVLKNKNAKQVAGLTAAILPPAGNGAGKQTMQGKTPPVTPANEPVEKGSIPKAESTGKTSEGSTNSLPVAEEKMAPFNDSKTTQKNSLAAQEQPAAKEAGAVANAAPAVSPVKKNALNFKGLYLHAGLLPEGSFISGNQVGPLTFAYGGGLGYTSGRRWSVQAGVYATRKNYQAGPGDYQAKPGTYFYNLKIFHVDAECNVLEIPVVFNYHLLKSRQHHLVASAGFASLVMNRETYDYDYERWNGTAAYSEHTYRTRIFHPFASLYLSAGYQYTVNDRLSIMASPYGKIPLKGVGEGNVKITSVGMMLGLQYGIFNLRSHKPGK